MKKLFLLQITVLVSLLSSAQAPFPNETEIKQFMESKTCVVLEDDPFSFYNSYIKEAVQTYWNLTPVEFIDVREFNKRRLDPAFSFIVQTQTSFDRDKSGSSFNFLNLLQGEKGTKLSELPEICAIPLSFAGEDDFDYAYKLGVILAFMQKHAQLIAEDPSLTGRRYLRYYNVNAPEVINKTILFKKEDLSPDVNTEQAIKAIYPFEIKIVEEEDIKKAIEEKASNTLILHKVGPPENYKTGYCFKMLIGADDADMYYYNQHMINDRNPNGFLESDLRRLARYK